MAFVKFKKEKNRGKLSAKTIGINEKGRFAFYKPVVSNHFREKEHVELFYDMERNKIGILPVDEGTNDSFKLQGKTTKMVIAKKFLNRFKIPVENRRYEFEIENDMIVVNLNEQP
jgi:hypothetical protein